MGKKKKRKKKGQTGTEKPDAPASSAAAVPHSSAEKPDAPASSPPRALTRRRAIILALLFLGALTPRLVTGLLQNDLAFGEGKYPVINHDQNNSCLSELIRYPYPVFHGKQIIALASLVGHPPPDAEGLEYQPAKDYCTSRPLILVGRIYSAVTGALTVVILGLIALMLWPAEPRIAWSASGLLALSNFHVAQSHWATVDAPLVFFLYLFLAVLLWGVSSRQRWPLVLSPIFCIAAMWTKIFVLAPLAYAVLLRRKQISRRALLGVTAVAIVVVVVVVLFGQQEVTELIRKTRGFLWGNERSSFGTGYAHIGTWRRWLRNGLNLPLVHIVGIGSVACLFLYRGARTIVEERGQRRLWLVFAPIAAYGLYMLLMAPATYYRHYLPLFPLVVLIASLGLWRSRWALKRWVVVLFFLYPALLTVDSEANYLNDPRKRLDSWCQKNGDPKLLTSFYVVPPRRLGRIRVFQGRAYSHYGPRYLQPVDYVVLSENWYDTAFANELNGPIAWRPEWLIKTNPAAVRLFRRILSGEDPNLRRVERLRLIHFMPEFLLHRSFYGTYQLFIGDLDIFEVVR